jgi:pyruvate dehydrogenase E2 component (dihydrolipoamide acetyltransferase)
MEEGTITKWLKNEGESVEKGEPLLEVMTDKANMEVEAPASGILRRIIAAEGVTVPIKDLIAIIGSADEPIDELLPNAPVAAAVSSSVSSSSSFVQAEQVVKRIDTSVSKGRLLASPRAKKVAGERGIDINLLAGKGTGPNGRIIEADVVAFVAQLPAPVKATSLASKIAAEMGLNIAKVAGTGPGGKVTRDDVLRMTAPKVERPAIGQIIPLAGIRKLVADNVSASIRTAPHVTLTTEVDMTACVDMREQLLPEFEKRYGVRLTYTGIVVKAAALAIQDHPIINSSLAEDKIIIHDEVNIGVAAAIEDGLTVPVIRDVLDKPLYKISEDLAILAAKARAGSLALDEMQGGTFTITNLAAYGIDIFNPIINPPESAILGVCRTVQKPVVIDGQVQIRSMMNLCLSFDHRVMDGAPAAEYLARVKQLLEAPYLLLI